MARAAKEVSADDAFASWRSVMHTFVATVASRRGIVFQCLSGPNKLNAESDHQQIRYVAGPRN